LPTSPAGTGYFVRTANTLGFVDVLYDATPCISCVVTTGKPVAVTAGGAPTSGINFALAGGGTITGTVRAAATLTGLQSVTVSILTGDGRIVKFTPTNATGLFSVTGLAGGTYFARTSNDQGFIDQLYSGKSALGPAGAGTAISVTAGSTSAAINFDL